jgi:hypothetical protein
MSQATPLHNRRSLNDSLEMINRHGLPGHGKTEMCHQMPQAVTTTVKGVLEHRLEEELTQYLGLARYAPRPWGRRPELPRSGTYGRALLTQ